MPEAPFEEPRYELERLVTVEIFHSLWEAELAKASLESEGIEATVANESLVRLNLGMSAAMGGVQLQVREADAQAAIELLRRAARRSTISLVEEGEGEEVETRCPGCNSEDLQFERWSRHVFIGALLLFGVPLPIPRHRWSCRQCGSSWKRGELV